MKTKRILFITLISLFLTSCAPKPYFQVYKTTPSENLVRKDKLLVNEDKNCKVSYDLWGKGGNIGFEFFNKTDKNIYLNMEESFFVLNGVSYNYYRSRVFTNSTSSGVNLSRGVSESTSITGLNSSDLLQTDRVTYRNTAGITKSSGHSVSFNEEKIKCIPSKTTKIIQEYKINESIYRDCELFKYPRKNQIKTKIFSKSDSPFVFSNRIAYTIGSTGDLVKFENEFFVSEIYNLPDSEMFSSEFDEYCGQTTMKVSYHFKNVSADKFYVKYHKGIDEWRH